MGFFGKLFEKKQCSICNGEIGLLGNRKLEDGNMCKNCEKQLSPWFYGRRTSTVAEMEEHLDYRANNEREVASFNPTLTLGDNYKILFDEDARKLLVTDSTQWKKKNPDIMSYDQITGCEFSIEEDVVEAKHENKDGEEVSYVPARYYYEYDFYIKIHVNSPYFSEISFKLNSSTVDITDGNAVIAMRKPNPSMHREYQAYEQMGNEIKKQLSDIRNKVREEVTQAKQEKVSCVCPWCGASTFPDELGRCEYCKGKVN